MTAAGDGAGRDVRVALTFDFDALSNWIGSLGLTTPGPLSRGEFSPIGARRVLSLLAEYRAPATFFTPGHTAVAYPGAVAAVLEAGHEIAHHGWILSDPDMVRAVAVGSLPIGIAEVGSGIAAREKGGDVVVVASFLDRYPYDLMVKPAIKSYPDLKGKVLAHWQTSPSVGLELLRRLLAQNGLKDADYKVIAGGNSPARYAALVSGGIDGAILTTPTNTMAKKEGFNALGGLYDIPAVFAAVLANGAWAKSNEADMVAWLRALVRGFHYAADPKNRDEVVTLLTREFKAPSPEPFVHDLKMFYEDQKFLLSWELMPAEKSVQGVLDILSAIGQVPSPAPPTSKYFELAYLKKAAAEVKR